MGSAVSAEREAISVPVHPVHKMRKLVLLDRQGGNDRNSNCSRDCTHPRYEPKAFLCVPEIFLGGLLLFALKSAALFRDLRRRDFTTLPAAGDPNRGPLDTNRISISRYVGTDHDG